MTYLVVGAGAAGLAFTDALLDHCDARVVLIDKHSGAGGHWRAAYPFVRLHQASCFYGVASTELGTGRLQTAGPEIGLAERATGAEVLRYFEDTLDRLCASGRVEFHGGATWTGGAAFRTADGREHTLDGARVVDATYRAATIPASSPPPFEVAPGAWVEPVNTLPDRGPRLPAYVIAGAGKTATDACVWLLRHGVPPEAITWVRSREPWMLNRAVVQPDPGIMLTMAADTWTAAAASTSVDDFFVRLEAAGIMLRIDPAATPTMAKSPTLAQWELDLLRSIPRVVRHGHLTRVSPGFLEFGSTRVPIPQDALIVHCAAIGHAYPPLVPIWGEVIRLQTSRAGFPCFSAALVGYVEATRDDDAEKNRLCPPSPLPDTLASWCAMQVLGARASAAFLAQPDIARWAQTTSLNPARLQPADRERPEVAAALRRLSRDAPQALGKLSAYAGLN
ncbi:NAD(P)-binding protein [Granulicoccus phenolivorans]|uniref:NAD(P)-binding protein n=1 Tax=Granulicoccus phenolivorans TaxID=266854 RepID=UPI000417FD64|nr:NAD(P)-binding protein [Granulicoccus phenolivorans]